MTNDQELLEAAQRLAQTLPNEWKLLHDELQVYTSHRMQETVNAGMDNVVILQGMARQCVEFLTIFETAAKPRPN